MWTQNQRTQPLFSSQSTRDLAAILLFGAACGNLTEPAEPVEPVARTASSIHVNAGSSSLIGSELNTPTGAYPAVVSTPGCTGSIVGPYAVLTAAHCADSGGIGWGGSGQWFAIAASQINPYLQPAYRPNWWIALNEQQKAAPGGRQDDWPAQHDHRIQFVPSLTPDVLAQNGILPVRLEPYERVTHFAAVGIGSTGGDFRDYVPAKYVAATPNTITADPRDGYFTHDTGTANYGSVDAGDSGGPTLGFYRQSWGSGSSFDVNHTVFSTTQNTGGDTAPLAYNAGIPLTANQSLTVRYNALWAQARANDADSDGLPDECDPDPTVATSGSSLCPRALGGPSGGATANAPAALLRCRVGYLPVGIRGRSGDLIDQLALKCAPIACLGSGIGCADSYYTDAFGGSGGGAFEDTCPTGQVLAGFSGSDDGSYLYSLAGRCAALSSIKDSKPVFTSLPTHGGTRYGTAFAQACANNQAVIGVQARTSDKRWVTGLQAICSSAGSYTSYAGGSLGGPSSLTCPPGMLAIGTVQRPEGGNINVFGLLCASRAAVLRRERPTSIANRFVAHPGYMHYAGGFQVVSSVEPLGSVHLPAGASYAYCPSGQALAAVQGLFGSYVNHIASLTCERLAEDSQSFVAVGIGGTTGTYKSLNCPAGEVVDGFYTRSGWLTDGFLLKCRKK